MNHIVVEVVHYQTTYSEFHNDSIITNVGIELKNIGDPIIITIYVRN